MRQYSVMACFALVLILHVAPSQATLVNFENPGFSILELVSPTSIVFAGSGSNESLTPNGDTIPFDNSEFVDPFLATLFDGNDGCESSDFSGFTPGYVALVARGGLGCLFQDKALNAAAAGASGIIVYDIGINFLGGNICGLPPCPEIAGIFVKQDVGQELLSALVSRQGVATV